MLGDTLLVDGILILLGRKKVFSLVLLLYFLFGGDGK